MVYSESRSAPVRKVQPSHCRGQVVHQRERVQFDQFLEGRLRSGGHGRRVRRRIDQGMMNVHPDASSIHLKDEWNLYLARRAAFLDGHAANPEVVA